MWCVVITLLLASPAEVSEIKTDETVVFFPAVGHFDRLSKEGFPAGTFHLKTFRLTDASFLNLFEEPYEYKLDILEPLLKTFPRRRFILVGDSSEKDPEVYGELARRCPRQILRIFIRNVTGQDADPDRYPKAFEGVPAEVWRVFDDPRALPGSIGQ